MILLVSLSSHASAHALEENIFNEMTNDTLTTNISLAAAPKGACFVSTSCSGKKLSSSNTCGHCLHQQGKTKGGCWVSNGTKVKKQSNCPK